jgi:hypothetical protein
MRVWNTYAPPVLQLDKATLRGCITEKVVVNDGIINPIRTLSQTALSNEVVCLSSEKPVAEGLIATERLKQRI